MSIQDNRRNAILYIAEQSNKLINYEWELQHHIQMHRTYNQY